MLGVAELVARRLVDRHRDSGRRRVAAVPRMEHECFGMLALGRQFRSPSGKGAEPALCHERGPRGKLLSQQNGRCGVYLDMPRERSTSRPSLGNRVIPAEPTIPGLRAAAKACTACSLYKNATQTVFGEGPEGSLLMLVGEQPGDVEDIAGKPFVGPAGRLLDRCLIEAGIDRARIYVTNAVKHFKWVPRGPRRIHSKPGAREIQACYPWLEAEIATLKPQIIVCLGATAAQALLGRTFRVSQRRGEFIASPLAPHVMATIHPASLLREPDPATREAETARFVAELR